MAKRHTEEQIIGLEGIAGALAKKFGLDADGGGSFGRRGSNNRAPMKIHLIRPGGLLFHLSSKGGAEAVLIPAAKPVPARP